MSKNIDRMTIEELMSNYEEGYVVARNTIEVDNVKYTISTVYLGGVAKQFETLIFDASDWGIELYGERFEKKEVAKLKHNVLLTSMCKKEFVIYNGKIKFINELENECYELEEENSELMERIEEVKKENKKLKIELMSRKMKQCYKILIEK